MSLTIFENTTILLSGILTYLIILWPIAKIIRRAGFSRLWILVAFVPFINIIMLWVFAYARWSKDPNNY